MPHPPFLLLPPSLGKIPGGRAPSRAGVFDVALSEPRAQVLSELERVLGAADATLHAKVFKARGDLLDRALESATAMVERRALLLPSWQRYSGVVWTHLEPSSLSISRRRRIIIPSGLYGLTTGMDPIADYRLTMQGELGRLGSLRAHWKEPITDLLIDHIGRRPVVDMLPAEHALAIDSTRLADTARLVTVRFVSSDGRHAIGHDAKAAKGRVARAILDEGIDGARYFAWEGWRARLAESDQIEVMAPVTR